MFGAAVGAEAAGGVGVVGDEPWGEPVAVGAAQFDGGLAPRGRYRCYWCYPVVVWVLWPGVGSGGSGGSGRWG